MALLFLIVTCALLGAGARSYSLKIDAAVYEYNHGTDNKLNFPSKNNLLAYESTETEDNIPASNTPIALNAQGI